MQYFRKLAAGIDVAPVLAELDAHQELWDQFTLRKTAPGTPHSGMSDIWVRYNDIRPFLETGDFRRFNDAHVPVWYPAHYVLPALQPILMGMMSDYQGEMLGGVLITRIPPGAGIAPHTDHSWHVDYYDKFYLSLRSAPGATFHCGDEVINPAPGDLYLFDNHREHWVVNASDQDRVTLIVCMRTAYFGRVT